MTQAALVAAQFPEAQGILEFWFGDALLLGWPSRSRGDLWFGGGAALDRQIDGAFGTLVRDAVQGGQTPWEDYPFDRLALILLLDQFTRNVFRGLPAAFSGDTRACALAQDSIAQGWQEKLPLAGRVFLGMPLMHSESLPLQEHAVTFYAALHAGAPREHQDAVRGNLEAAREHHEVIARFGRFPHRNAVLGRDSTASELAYLKDGRRFGQ